MKKWLYPLIGVTFWLVAWELLALGVGNETLLPTVGQTLSALWRMAFTGEFYRQILDSLLRILIGIVGGLYLGFLTGVASHFAPLANSVFSPLMRVLRATPVASVIILALVWWNSSVVPSLAVLTMVAPIVFGSVKSGLSAVNPDMLEMCRLYEIPLSARLRTLYVPSLRPYLYSSVVTAVGLGWKAGIASEVIARPLHALGTAIYDTKTYLETPDLFAVTLVVILISVALERLAAYLLRKEKA